MDVACSGIYNSKTCNPERWYHFLGDVSNPLVPFEMVYKFSQTDENRFVEETRSCHEAYEVENKSKEIITKLQNHLVNFVIREIIRVLVLIVPIRVQLVKRLLTIQRFERSVA